MIATLPFRRPKPKLMVDTVSHADGTEQTLRRHTPGGASLPIGQTGRTWDALIALAPTPTGGAWANPSHPSRKRDGPTAAEAAPVLDAAHDSSGVRRRDRRAAARAAARS